MMSKKICFIFASPKYHSGQATASRMLVDGFRSREWLVRSVELPALDQSKNPFKEMLICLPRFLISCIQVLLLNTERRFVLHVNLGQTLFSFFREGLILVFFSILRGPEKTIVGLHGSNFMQWEKGCFHAIFFRFILMNSSMVCVLGNSQKKKLIALGIPSERVTVMPNTCLLEPKLLTEKIKFHEESDQATPFRVLFLSNLIPSKGFPVFLEALDILSLSTKRKIEAVLCGKLVDGKLDNRFNSYRAAENWIEATMARINKSDSLRISWQKGADGSLKASIFNQSHLFVFPTSYFNEAQPIVLIEALASGCGIITTNVGEITSTVSGNEGMILEEPSPRYLAESIEAILGDQKLRMKQVKAGHSLFHKRFSMEKHLDNWEALFSEVIFLERDAE